MNEFSLLVVIRMPVKRHEDRIGPYYQWGNSGKKYRYTSGNERSRQKAYKKALKQGRAIIASVIRKLLNHY